MTANVSEYTAYSKLIYKNLEEDASMDIMGNPLLTGLMNQHSGMQDEYVVLKGITERFANKKENRADSANQNAQPKFDNNIFAFAGELASYHEYQTNQNQYWNAIEKTTVARGNETG